MKARLQDKVILGIDPGTNILGYGVISIGLKGPEYMTMGTIDMRKEKDPFKKLDTIFTGTGRIMDLYHPDFVAIESPFYGKNAQVILKLGRAQGAAITAALHRGIPVEEYAPRKAKVAITGIGSASKEQVCNMIHKILNVDAAPAHLDATDALAMALCHYYQLTSPLTEVRSTSGWKKFIEDNPDRVKK